MSLPELAPFVVCPQTLGPLEPAEGGFFSPRAQRLYPYEHGLVFMGYPERDAAMIGATMAEERDHQGLGEEAAAANLAYLREAAPLAVDFLNFLRPFVDAPAQPRALELGSGNGWFSWLLAAAGFQTWMCDFEANSLATGQHLEHPNLGPGRRFVTDARFAPIASGSIDLVVFKEFVHHVADYPALFREAARVLRPGGVMALQEPVRSLSLSFYELRHPDPHEGHHITWPDAYLRSVRSCGLELVSQGPAYGAAGNSRLFTAWMKRRAIAAIDARHPAGNWLTKLQFRLFGGAQLRLVARKVAAPAAAPRPPMTAIPPSTLVIDDADLERYAEFPAILAAAAERLEARPVA